MSSVARKTSTRMAPTPKNVVQKSLLKPAKRPAHSGTVPHYSENSSIVPQDFPQIQESALRSTLALTDDIEVANRSGDAAFEGIREPTLHSSLLDTYGSASPSPGPVSQPSQTSKAPVGLPNTPEEVTYPETWPASQPLPAKELNKLLLSKFDNALTEHPSTTKLKSEGDKDNPSYETYVDGWPRLPSFNELKPPIPFHDPDRHPPWRPSIVPDSALYKAHKEHQQRWIDQERKNGLSNPSDDGLEDKLPVPSWNKRVKIARLSENPKYLARMHDWKRRAAAIKGVQADPVQQSRKLLSVASLGEHAVEPSAAADALKAQIESQPLEPLRRIVINVDKLFSRPEAVLWSRGVRYDPYGRDQDHDNDSPANNSPAARSRLFTLMRKFWEHMEGTEMPTNPVFDSPDGLPILNPPLLPGEEFDFFETEVHELEDMIDTPDEPIGIFNRSEVHYHQYVERKKTIERMRKTGYSDDEVEEWVSQETGHPAEEVARIDAEARESLISRRMLLPDRVTVVKPKVLGTRRSERIGGK